MKCHLKLHIDTDIDIHYTGPGRNARVTTGKLDYLELADDVRLVLDGPAVSQLERAAEVDKVVERCHALQRRRINLRTTTQTTTNNH